MDKCIEKGSKQLPRQMGDPSRIDSTEQGTASMTWMVRMAFCLDPGAVIGYMAMAEFGTQGYRHRRKRAVEIEPRWVGIGRRTAVAIDGSPGGDGGYRLCCNC